MNLHTYNRQLLIVSLYLLSAVALPATAQAIKLTDLFAGASLSAGTTQFTDWELVAVDSLAQPGPDLSQIDVLALVDDPANPGVQLVANGELSTVGLNNINLVVKFNVSPSVTERLVGHKLDLSDVTFSGVSGIAFVTGELADGGGDPVTSALVMADKESDFFLTPAESPFAPEAQLEVTWDVFVTGFSAAAPVNLNSFTQRFAVATIPEPTGLALVSVTSLVGFVAGRPKRCRLRRQLFVIPCF
jgi:hypothetical protein